MTGYTHAAVAANAVWITVFWGMADATALPLIAIAAFAGLMPDIDAPQAKIHRKTFGITKIFAFGLKHRGVLHSLIAAVGTYGLAHLFLANIHPLIPIIVLIAYLSHLMLDAMNISGIPLLYPLNTRFNLLPKKISPKVGGALDIILFVVSMLGIFLFVALYGLPPLSISDVSHF